MNDKYIYSSHTIALPASIERLPGKIIVQDTKLILKSAFHVSLFCIGKLIEKHKIEIDNFENKILGQFEEFIRHYEIQLIKLSNFRFVEDKERKTLIVMCEVSEINNFYDFINSKYNLDLDYQPTHITLYTLQKDKGIFLIDNKDIEEKTKIVDLSIQVRLK